MPREDVVEWLVHLDLVSGTYCLMEDFPCQMELKFWKKSVTFVLHMAQLFVFNFDYLRRIEFGAGEIGDIPGLRCIWFGFGILGPANIVCCGCGSD